MKVCMTREENIIIYPTSIMTENPKEIKEAGNHLWKSGKYYEAYLTYELALMSLYDVK